MSRNTGPPDSEDEQQARLRAAWEVLEVAERTNMARLRVYSNMRRRNNEAATLRRARRMEQLELSSADGTDGTAQEQRSHESSAGLLRDNPILYDILRSSVALRNALRNYRLGRGHARDSTAQLGFRFRRIMRNGIRSPSASRHAALNRAHANTQNNFESNNESAEEPAAYVALQGSVSMPAIPTAAAAAAASNLEPAEASSDQSLNVLYPDDEDDELEAQTSAPAIMAAARPSNQAQAIQAPVSANQNNDVQVVMLPATAAIPPTAQSTAAAVQAPVANTNEGSSIQLVFLPSLTVTVPGLHANAAQSTLPNAAQASSAQSEAQTHASTSAAAGNNAEMSTISESTTTNTTTTMRQLVTVVSRGVQTTPSLPHLASLNQVSFSPFLNDGMPSITLSYHTLPEQSTLPANLAEHEEREELRRGIRGVLNTIKKANNFIRRRRRFRLVLRHNLIGLLIEMEERLETVRNKIYPILQRL